MSAANEQHYEITKPEPDSIKIPVTDLLIALWQQRYLLAAVILIGFVVSITIAMVMPNEFTSTAQLMPPDQQAFANVSSLSALAGTSALMPSNAGLLSTRTPGSTAIGFLNSRTLQDYLIDRFDLLKVYHVKFHADARKKLIAESVFEEDKKSGLVSIAVTNKDRYLARDIAKGYIEELNALLIAENTSSAHREREFLEDRLKSLKANLDATSETLSKFSSHNATLNPQTQGQALIEAASRLQAELITAQAELYGLKAQYSDDNVRVRSVQARIAELQGQLKKMTGVGVRDNAEDLKEGQPYPSIRELPLLGATYSDLARQVAMDEGIYETLTKQYEIAKVQEAKEIPTIKVLDQPDLVEKKSGPWRTMIVVVGVLISAFIGIIWVIASTWWKLMDQAEPLKSSILRIWRTVRGHTQAATS